MSHRSNMACTEATHSQISQLRHVEPSCPSGFITLYDLYFARVYNYIRYRCGDADIADDLTAAVFEKALLNFHRYESDRAPFSAWLFTIARNVVNSHLRHYKVCHHTPLESIPEQPDWDDAPEACIISSETCEELLTALKSLDARERDLLSLKFGAHLTNRRIAVITKLSETNVGVIIHRALKKLRYQLVSQV